MTPLRFAQLSTAASLVVCGGLGCAPEVYPAPPPTVVYSSPAYANPYPDNVYAYEDVPPDLTIYPHVVYGGAPVYYYHDRWYRSTPRGWGYYRSPPAELQRQRSYVQQAPPARAYPESPGRTYAPAAPAVNSAPPAPAPAQRVR